MVSKKVTVTDEQFLDDLGNVIGTLETYGIESNRPLLRLLKSLVNQDGMRMKDYLRLDETNQDRFFRLFKRLGFQLNRNEVQGHLEEVIDSLTSDEENPDATIPISDDGGLSHE